MQGIFDCGSSAATGAKIPSEHQQETTPFVAAHDQSGYLGRSLSLACRFSKSVMWGGGSLEDGCIHDGCKHHRAVFAIDLLSELITDRHFIWGQLIPITDTESRCQKN